ncbi:DEAD-box ATP-dependent RNA helicase 58, chloroplastic [Linum perenne]
MTIAAVSTVKLLHISTSISLPKPCSVPSKYLLLTGHRRPFRPLQAALPASPVVGDEESRGSEDDGGVPTLRELCQDHVPDHVLSKAEEVGYVMPTDVQKQALPVLFSGQDCIVHAQVGLTGSGKTLAYLLLIFSVVNAKRSAVQALIVVPTRELGIQVTKVARMLASKAADNEKEQKSSFTIMALLDGGMLKRHKSWLKAEPPSIVVATIASLCHMLDKHVFKLDAIKVLVIDERDVVHVHVSAIKPMPSCLQHRFVVCANKRRHEVLLSLLHSEAPKSTIIFVGEQSEKSKNAGNDPSTILLVEFLRVSYRGSSEILLLEKDMNFNSRAASLSEMRQGEGYLLVATDIAARGVDLPETTHIYNFDLPRSAVDYLHRAGRAGRKPFSEEKCNVTNIIKPEERFVLQKYENELMFNCEEVVV